MPSKYHRPTAKNQRPRRQPTYESLPQHAPDDRPNMTNYVTAKTWHTCLTVMVTDRAKSGMTFGDKSTAGMASWDADNGAGRKRTSRTAKEPMGYTARKANPGAKEANGLSEAALKDLKNQRAWAR